VAKDASSASPKALVVVESPAKARTIEQYLGTGFTVRASMGHVRDLPKKELGVDLEKDTFRPKYVSIRSKSKILTELKKLAGEAETVYLATDPDREGEAIAWHVATAIGGKDALKDTRFRRLTFNEITRAAVTAAIENDSEIDWNKVEAQQARRVLDRLVGYQVSPILWKALYRGLSAGRVQSVALRLISEREDEIDAFEPQEYWTLEAVFQTSVDGAEVVYPGTLDKVEGKPAEISDEATSQALSAGVREQEYAISKVERKKRRRNPSPPFITSTLQQEAARKLGFSAKKTMMVAQRLYEGIEIPGEGAVGLITYMRTDSVRVAGQAVEAARERIAAAWGDEYLPAKPRQYKSRKGAQDAHEAIRPTDLDRPPDRAKAVLDKDQSRLYELIWNRFLASQMESAELEGTVVLTTGGPYVFKSTGSVVIFPGYLAIYREGTDDPNNSGTDDGDLPAGLAEGRPARLHELEEIQHFTKPPARFTEASLVKELEQDGIGRPSTYAQIISVLIDRTYVSRERKSLIPTDLGRTVSRILVNLFPDIFQVEFTAQMEEELDKIESGQDDYVSVLSHFYEPFARDIEEAQKEVPKIKEGLQEDTGEACEECGKPMVIKWGRRGRFQACSGYPECKFTRPLAEEEEEQIQVDARCPDCDAEMTVKSGRFGRFLACTRYPDCKGTLPLPVGVNCPECGRPMAEKRSRKGRVFYGCTGYPECKFATWDPPVDKRCPVCDYAILVDKTTKTDGHHLHCPGCKAVLDPESL
jgi:DNA topoisomerase-1